MIRVGFTFNMKRKDGFEESEVEWDAPETIEAISSALSRSAEVVPIEAVDGVYEKLRKEKVDIVFNYAEGKDGENREAEVPAMVESLKVPYTGSDPVTMNLCLNKAKAKELLKRYGVRTADFAVVNSMDELSNDTPFPSIVKPVWEGSSKGIHNNAVVNNQKELSDAVEGILSNYRQPALIETFLPGREFTIGILGNPPEARVLPIVEIDHSVLPEGIRPIMSYEAKWVVDDPKNPLKILVCPAGIDQGLRTKLENISLDTYHLLGCRDWCRMDIRLDGNGEPSILEVNPLPGLLPNPEDNSCFPTAARAAGYSFDDLVNEVLDIALARYGMARNADSLQAVKQ